MDAEMQSCMNERNSSQHEPCAHDGNVADAADVIELNGRRLDEAVFRPSQPLATGMATRHS